jgi:DNA-directed RNA polymerase specialized sigma24 family protein
MKDPRLAAALLESSPDALAELFDAYGDRLFRYCWSMLRSRELARVALRDTLLVAQAHIARLADPEDPESLGPWLYSLARAECRRHQAVPPADADESPVRQGLPASDARLMSWHAAMGLEATEFEALDLACRHYVDLALVLGLPAGEADDLLDRARQNLERSLGAEILAGRGPACPGREAALAGPVLAGSGPLTAEARERVLEHADSCATCGPEVPRNVSATRVFALLPAVALTPQDRAAVLAVLAGQQPPAAPALAQAALVPASSTSGAVPARPAPAAPATSAPAAFATSGTTSVTPAPGLDRSVLGPSLASYVQAPEPPVRFLAAPIHAPETPVPVPAAPPAPSAPRLPAASAAPAAFAALTESSSPAAASAPPVPASGPSPQEASSSPARRPLSPRRVHRGRLLIAGAGVLVSAVVIASAIATAGAGEHTAAGSITPTLAAGGATGSALASGLGAADPVSSRARPGATGGRPAGLSGASGSSGVRPTTAPPLVTTKSSKNQVMIIAATQPQAPSAKQNGGGAGGATAGPGTLQLSAGGVVLGPDDTGQITLTAANGTVSWSASVSRPGTVSLSSYRGTLAAGASITLTVQVSQGSGAGSAAISFQGGGPGTQVVPVTWSGQPAGSGPSWHQRPAPPGPSPSSGSMSGTGAPGPTSLGSDHWHRTGRDDPARYRSGRP